MIDFAIHILIKTIINLNIFSNDFLCKVLATLAISIRIVKFHQIPPLKTRLIDS